MAETNGHEGISHPFGEKHGAATKGKRDLADRMYPGFHDFLARGSAAYATQLWTARHKEAVEAVKADLRELTLSHDEKHHAGWQSYTPEPDAPLPYCSVGARFLDVGMTVPRIKLWENFHTEHQQIICNNGDNFGLTDDNERNDVFREGRSNLYEYIMSPVKYRRDIVMQARKALEEEWIKNGSGSKRYDVFDNNCQHHIEKVLNKATEIAREKQVKLIID